MESLHLAETFIRILEETILPALAVWIVYMLRKLLSDKEDKNQKK